MAKQPAPVATRVQDTRKAALSCESLVLEKPIYTLKETAFILGLSPGTLYDAIRNHNELYPRPAMNASKMVFTRSSILACQSRRREYYLKSGRGHC
jgi:hypothetical protein